MRRLLAVCAVVLAGAGLWMAMRPSGAGRAGPNVILICVDGCRADHLGGYGYPRDTSPTLDRLGREGVVFLRNYAQANESLFSHASLFSSRYPSELGPLDYTRYRVPPDLTTLQKILQSNGYHTGAFTGGGHIMHEFGFDGGFDIYTDSFAFDGYAISEPKAVAWMRANREHPMFVFLHGYDCHRPYTPPTIFRHLYGADYKGYADHYLGNTWSLDRIYNATFYPDYEVRQTWTASGQRPIDPRNYADLARESRTLRGVRLQPDDVKHIVDHYDSSITYADTWIGAFMGQIADLGLDASNTLVIVLADHGEDLMEHGYFNHRIGLQTSNVHVPLIFWGAGVSKAAAGTRSDLVTANLDVAPTILSMLGLPVPPQARGLNLAPLLTHAPVPAELQDRTVFTQGILDMSAVVSARHELICQGAPAGTEQMGRLLGHDGDAVTLYDLAADPHQLEPVDARQQTEVRNALRTALLRYETAARAPTAGAPVAPLDPELERSLKRHGYH